MWINALDERQQAYYFKHANHQEEILFELAGALSAEREQMYALFSRESVSQEMIAQLKNLSAKTDEFVLENASILASINVGPYRAVGQNHSSHIYNPPPLVANKPIDANHSGHSMSKGIEPMHTSDVVEMHSNDSQASKNTVFKEDGGIGTHQLSILRKNDASLYQQLVMPKNARNPNLGMQKFHDYTGVISSFDELRYALHTQSSQSLPEHYIVSKLKDAFWEFRESAAQTTSLLEGVAARTKESDDRAQLAHHADMLLELSVRLGISWDTLYKTIVASGNELMLSDANAIAVWYNNNFKGMSFGLVASTQHKSISKVELQEWLDGAHRLSLQSENVRKQSEAMTATLINNAVHRTNVKLIQVSILVFFSFCMTFASVFFFRRVDRQAHQDELTGLDNRRMFTIAVTKCLSASASETGILMIDLDRFKHINDTMGHSAGDALLKEVSARVSEAGDDCVSVARLGGDEFAMLFNGGYVDEMHVVAAKVRQALINPFRVGGATLKIGSSIGLAKAPRDAKTPDSLIQAADLAMYCAKKSGTNQISVYDSDVDQSMMIAARTVSELQTALVNNEFELYYQPQFNIAQAKVLSAEALIRWNHPERGFLAPNHFITIAEENGLMPSIGDWVIEEACRQAAVWLYEKKMPLRVAVNVSADHFFQNDFVKMIIDTLEKHKLPPHLLEVEVTESVAMNDINLVVKSLQQLRDLSIHVALDDFGTGYSSLSYLQELPLDTLKIDKSFIHNMLQGNAQKESITQTIVALGNRLNLETVAEGVETVDQLAAVSDMKISVVQGFYYSQPVSATELEFVVMQLNDADSEPKAA